MDVGTGYCEYSVSAWLLTNGGNFNMILRLNTRFIEDAQSAREAIMQVATALYLGMNRDTPVNEAAEVAGIYASLWRVCDALSEIAGGKKA